MTEKIQITRPNSRDPRFAEKGTPPAERARAAKEANVLRCARGASVCGTSVPVGDLPVERREAYAKTLGFVPGATSDTAHLLYCSKACRDAGGMPTAPTLCRCPTCRANPNDPLSAPGPKRCALATPQLSAGCPITRVSVRDVTDRSGKLHRAVVCDRWACDEARYVDPAATPERIAQFAHDSGFVQTRHGTTCGPSCAKQLERDVLAGRQDPLELSVEFVDEEREKRGLPPSGSERTVAVETSTRGPETAAESPASAPAPEAPAPSPERNPGSAPPVRRRRGSALAPRP